MEAAVGTISRGDAANKSQIGVCSSCKQETSTHTKTFDGDQKAICRPCFISFLGSIPRPTREKRIKPNMSEKPVQERRARKPQGTGLVAAVSRLEEQVKALREELNALKTHTGCK